MDDDIIRVRLNADKALVGNETVKKTILLWGCFVDIKTWL